MNDEEQFKRDGFYLSTPEYALMLGISTEALRSRRRRGELEGEYKTNGKKYWWKSVGPNKKATWSTHLGPRNKVPEPGI